MVDLLILCILIVVFALTIKNKMNGIYSFILIRILIPENVRVPFIDLSLNSMILFIVLFVILLDAFIKKTFKYNKKLFLAILFFVSYLCISLILSDYSDFNEQLHGIFQFIITDILPFVICSMIISNKIQVKNMIKIYLIACLITTSYGIISFILQNNPYLNFWMAQDVVYSSQWVGNYSTSTFVSTNSFGYFIGLSIPFLMFLKSKNIYNKFANVNVVLLLVNLLIARKRTTIVVVCCYFFMWFISGNPKKRLKNLLYAVPVIVACSICIFTIPQLNSIKNILMTSIFFWNDSFYNSVTNGLGGSTMGLRLRQFIYPFTEIKNNLLFGHGFSWCGYYLSQGSIHPILYGFESLITIVICELGVLGILIYPFVFFKLNEFAKCTKKNRYVTIFTVTYILQMIGTGFTYVYLILLILLMMHYVNKLEISNINLRRVLK